MLAATSSTLPALRPSGGSRRPSFAARRTPHRVHSTQDRDHPLGRSSIGDPHVSPLPRPAPASATLHQGQPARRPPSPELPSSLSTSDLEFGSDAFSGATLETPRQLAHEYAHPHQQQQQQQAGSTQQGQEERERSARLAQADLAREAFEAREAAQGIARLVLEGLKEEQDKEGVGDALFMTPEEVDEARREEAEAAAANRAALQADESTAAEREDRYQGILQALDSLGAMDTRGASDGENETQSPEAARLTVSGSAEVEESSEFDALRHTVDMLGEGEEAAELIMRSYAGRNLEEEAMRTMDPGDAMPHPGDRYLRPGAMSPQAAPLGSMEARLNSICEPDFEKRRGLQLSPPRGATSSQGQQHSMQSNRCRGGAAPSQAWLPPHDGSAAARAEHLPMEEGEDGAPAAQQAQQAQQAAQHPQQQGSGQGTADDQIELGPGPEDAWRREGPVGGGGGGGAGSGVGTADDQIDFDQDALRGIDAQYYAPEHAANPAVNEAAPPAQHVASSGGGRNVEAPEGAYDVDGDALRGADAMFYFKAATGSRSTGPGKAGSGGGSSKGPVQGWFDGSKQGQWQMAQEGPVWSVLASRDDEHSSFRRAMEEAAAAASSHQHAALLKARAGRRGGGGRGQGRMRAHQPLPAAVAEEGQQAGGAAPAGNGSEQGRAPVSAAHVASQAGQHEGRCETAGQAGILSSLRRRQADRREAEQTVQRLTGRLRGGRGPGEPEPSPAGRVLEVVIGRCAALGLGSAVASEILTQQSVVSQLLGRFEGPRQIEAALPTSQALALGVVVGIVLLTAVERIAGRGACPHWRPLGLPPALQIWLGRAAMALFALLIAYETVHSNRPAFGTLFYLWF